MTEMTENLNIRMPAQLLKAVKLQAQAEYISVSALVRMAISTYLKANRLVDTRETYTTEGENDAD